MKDLKKCLDQTSSNLPYLFIYLLSIQYELNSLHWTYTLLEEEVNFFINSWAFGHGLINYQKVNSGRYRLSVTFVFYRSS